jgi:hypothetical protein
VAGFGREKRPTQAVATWRPTYSDDWVELVFDHELVFESTSKG